MPPTEDHQHQLIAALAAATATAAGELALAAQAAKVADTLADYDSPIGLANETVDDLVRALARFAGGDSALKEMISLIVG